MRDCRWSVGRSVVVGGVLLKMGDDNKFAWGWTQDTELRENKIKREKKKNVRL